MMQGIDVSNNQGAMNIALPGVQAMMCKATESTNFVDTFCNGFIDQARKAHMPYGVYHFAGSSVNKTVGNPVDEANYFVDNVKGYVGNGVLMLDWEPYGYNLTVQQETRWVLSFVQQVHARTNVWPVIYMDGNHVAMWDTGDQAMAKEVASHCALIVAGGGVYDNEQGINNSNPGARPNVPTYWILFGWQYTSHGRVDGYGGNLDLNVYYVDPARWAKYANPAANVPQPQPQPHPQPPAPKPTPPNRTYTVVPGDTLSEIAARFGTTWQRLAFLNHIPNPDHITPGQVLHIDVAPQAPVHRSYTVVPGDTLSAIAARFGTTWQHLADLNNIPNPDFIRAGDVLRIS